MPKWQTTDKMADRQFEIINKTNKKKYEEF